jgi:hypothetical protein
MQSKFIQQPNILDEVRPIHDVVARIEKLNDGLGRFWAGASGWAPEDATELLTKSRLDRQVSLSRSLRHWIVNAPTNLEDGDLVLGWANLGSLMEGTIKLFLAVNYQDYKKDVATLKQTRAWHKTKEILLDPDGLTLDVLIDYCEKADLLDQEECKLARLVQARRNAIHAFKDRPIGTGVELHSTIKDYLTMLRRIANALPYPDDMYVPLEV